MLVLKEANGGRGLFKDGITRSNRMYLRYPDNCCDERNTTSICCEDRKSSV